MINAKAKERIPGGTAVSYTHLVVAHHDDVGIVAHHLDGVFQRLALG